MKTLMDLLAEDKNISPAMRACFKPPLRLTCPMCRGNGTLAARDPSGYCAYCCGRGYIVTEREQ